MPGLSEVPDMLGIWLFEEIIMELNFEEVHSFAVLFENVRTPDYQEKHKQLDILISYMYMFMLFGLKSIILELIANLDLYYFWNFEYKK